MHDARVFANSSVYSKGMSGTLFPGWKKNICGVEVSYCNVMFAKVDPR